MPALCHSFIVLTILSGASPRWFPIGCKALSSVAGGLLIALSPFTWDGALLGSPRRSPEKDDGSRDQGQSVEPGNISGPLSLHLLFFLHRGAPRSWSWCRAYMPGTPHLESMVSHKPSGEIRTTQSQKEQGAPVSPCISPLAGWGLGIRRPDGGTGEARLSQG